MRSQRRVPHRSPLRLVLASGVAAALVTAVATATTGAAAVGVPREEGLLATSGLGAAPVVPRLSRSLALTVGGTSLTVHGRGFGAHPTAWLTYDEPRPRDVQLRVLAATDALVAVRLPQLPAGTAQVTIRSGTVRSAPTPSARITVTAPAAGEGWSVAQAPARGPDLPPTTVPRRGGLYLPLHDGRTLVLGGYLVVAPYTVTTAEVYYPATREWSVAGEAGERRASMRAIELVTGEVLVLGGRVDVTNASGLSDATEIWSPTTRSFRRVGPLPGRADGLSLQLLWDGRVLALGGRVGECGSCGASPAGLAWVFDPSTEAWHSVAPPADVRIGRAGARLLTLPSGRILVAGGVIADVQAPEGYVVAVPWTAVFDPFDESWRQGPPLPGTDLADPGALEASALLDGRGLLTGLLTVREDDGGSRTVSWARYVLEDGRRLAPAPAPPIVTGPSSSGPPMRGTWLPDGRLAFDVGTVRHVFTPGKRPRVGRLRRGGAVGAGSAGDRRRRGSLTGRRTGFTRREHRRPLDVTAPPLTPSRPAERRGVPRVPSVDTPGLVREGQAHHALHGGRKARETDAAPAGGPGRSPCAGPTSPGPT